MKFDIQPTLENELVKLVPLDKDDFELLFNVASDPLIWEQHPNKNRYQRKVFKNFFEGALDSKGAFIIYEQATNKVVGSSRYYDYNLINNSIFVGYTFIAREFWGTQINAAIKKLMFDYAFEHVERVLLHIGATNFRSQKAIEKMGAKKVDEQEVAYYGEPNRLNFVYQVTKAEWSKGASSNQ
ncbi:MAG: N-acetyltransferase [Pedobacter sp.]|nr:MAG: N-acetyltransferase [Pedobacter sp.]